jgi:hypothetical protein
MVMDIQTFMYFSGNLKEVGLQPRSLSAFQASVQHMSFQKANYHSFTQLHPTPMKHLNLYILQLFLLLVPEAFPLVHLQVIN